LQVTPQLYDRAAALVRDAATRATRQRIEILAVLLAAPRALTHHEVERQVKRSLSMDRVTVYRVLDWLVARGLAHRISGDDRIWRFNAADEGHARRQHAHFKCNDCGEVICLETAMAARTVPLPAGYRPQEVELTVKGLCAGCGRSA
jgi:Fur family transcriptional regulator, ferric uptake regulator